MSGTSLTKKIKIEGLMLNKLLCESFMTKGILHLVYKSVNNAECIEMLSNLSCSYKSVIKNLLVIADWTIINKQFVSIVGFALRMI